METSVVRVTRRDRSNVTEGYKYDDEIVEDGEHVTRPLMLMDGNGKAIDTNELDEKHKSYLDWKLNVLPNSWRRGRVADDRRRDGGDEDVRTTIDDAERVRSRAQQEYVDRISRAWRANRG